MLERKRFIASTVALALLGVSLQATAESWVLVYSGEREGSHFVDMDSLERWGGGLKYRVRTSNTAGVEFENVMLASCAAGARVKWWSGQTLPAPRPLGSMSTGTLAYKEVEAACARAAQVGLLTASEATLPPGPPPPPIAFPRAPAAPLRPPQIQPTQPRAPAPQERTRSTGSGFVVSPKVVVTNFHVIEGCATLTVRHNTTVVDASVLAATERNDLAAIALARPVGIPAPVRNSALLGEDIVVAGHPLAGVLSSDLIVTGGQINSLAGLGNDPNMLQISAPVQPGNSGGPLLDRSGAVVGVVVSKLNVERLAKFTGDLAQNVNFAIKPELVRLFLDVNRIPYRTTVPGKRLEGFEIAERARAFTVQVICD